MAGSKSLPKEMAEYVRREFDAYIARECTDADGTRWSQHRIAAQLGISQSQTSQMMRGKNAGTTALLALSKATKKPINDLLGPTAPLYGETREIRRLVSTLIARLHNSGFGFAGKNYDIPGLLRQLEAIVRPLTPEEYAAYVTETAAKYGKTRKKKASTPTAAPAVETAMEPSEKVGT